MKFQVLWNRNAENDLADLWLQATDRSAITQSAREIETLLEINPLECGESREFTERRALFNPPLAVIYHVVPDDFLVVITRVRRTS